MEHVKALLIKFVMIAVLLSIILTGIYNGEFSDTLLLSVVLTVVAYVLGDLFVFYRSGSDYKYPADHTHFQRNFTATICDAVLTFFVVWLMGRSLFINDGDVLVASFVSAIAIAAGEWFFHKYLDRHVFDEKRRLTRVK
ncbi:DUF2512 family protein [Domibacillus robiginosus]|uniref:DUF2512 family protein n=1 Tax=Domibacillus robiginosus TaxID=1071054 RepID=UPI00067D98CE|nr:DUF2512 family protein [Domibacillus robiginosus]